MPRKSASELALGGLRAGPSALSPPPGLGARERKFFADIVASVPPGHLMQEDIGLVVMLARAQVQLEMAANAISEGSRDAFWIKLQDSATKTVNMAMLRLRLGARARDPTARRRAGSAIKPGEEWPPWGRSPYLHSVPDEHDSKTGERNFAALRAQVMGERGAPNSGMNSSSSSPTSETTTPSDGGENAPT
jgi:hypothetical protein